MSGTRLRGLTLSDTAQDAIAVITARGGSKRVPGKNIRSFHGKPLISWTIQNLLSSHVFSRVIVSTDSEEIASISRKAGADVPFLRPSELSDDFTPTAHVANHAIRWLIEDGATERTEFCIVYPAAVAVTAADLAESRGILQAGGADLVFAACEFPSHPKRAWVRGDGSEVFPVSSEAQLARTQELSPWYYDAGQFYWSYRSGWEEGAKGHPIRRAMYLMPRSRAIDIDTEEDWLMAETLFNPNLYR